MTIPSDSDTTIQKTIGRKPRMTTIEAIYETIRKDEYDKFGHTSEEWIRRARGHLFKHVFDHREEDCRCSLLGLTKAKHWW